MPDFSLVDGVIETYRPVIAAVEASVLESTGAYLQGLWTHSVPPTLGTPAPPDELLNKPSDVSLCWDDVIPAGLPTAWHFACAIHVYNAPALQGYRMLCAVMVDGVRWQREIDEMRPWLSVVWTDPDGVEA